MLIDMLVSGPNMADTENLTDLRYYANLHITARKTEDSVSGK